MVDRAIYSNPASDAKSPSEWTRASQDPTAALMSFPVATGRLFILDSRVKEPAGQDDLGSIEWIKFRVELRVPCGFAVAIGSGKLSIDSSACAQRQGDQLN